MRLAHQGASATIREKGGQGNRSCNKEEDRTLQIPIRFSRKIKSDYNVGHIKEAMNLPSNCGPLTSAIKHIFVWKCNNDIEKQEDSGNPRKDSEQFYCHFTTAIS